MAPPARPPEGGAEGMRPYRRVFEGGVTREDRARNPYLELPFEMPVGAGRLEVRYRHDPGSILDIGLLDPDICPFPSPGGLRGWSGGARDRFFVAIGSATPGYLPGPLRPGTWRVLLGMAQIASGGCRYRVEIEVLPGRGEPLPPFAFPGPAGAAGWYRGDLQSHTHHSDARGGVADLIAAARSRGLDFLAVTDHNTSSHHRELAAASSGDLLLIPGQEVTTYKGHANVWGVAGTVDFRVWEAEVSGGGAVAAARTTEAGSAQTMWERLIEQVHSRGGLLSLNHPKTQPGCIGCDWQWPIPARIDAFEAWQGPWPFGNSEALARYDALLAQGQRLTLVGGSDRHQPGWPDDDPLALQVGSPTTWMQLEDLSVPAVLAAVRRGRVCVSDSPEGPWIDIAVAGVPMGSPCDVRGRSQVEVTATLKRAEGLRLRWLAQSGIVREVDVMDARDCWRWRPEGKFLRAELVAPSHPPELIALIERGGRSGKFPHWFDVDRALQQPSVRALSNPVYLS